MLNLSIQKPLDWYLKYYFMIVHFNFIKQKNIFIIILRYNFWTQLRILIKKTDERQFFWFLCFWSASSKAHQCRQKNRWPPNSDHIVGCETSWLRLLWFESRVKDFLKQNYGINYISCHRQTVIKFQIISAVVWEIFCKNKSNHIFTIFFQFQLLYFRLISSFFIQISDVLKTLRRTLRW